jgi:hypothetical protein
MNVAVMTERIAEASPRSKGRSAGFFWLMTMVTGTLAMLAAQKVLVSGDAAETAANLLAHEQLYRLGVAANLIATVCYLVATVLVYALLAPVNKNVSLLAASFSLVGCASGAVSFLFYLAPLTVLGGAPYLSAFSADQLHALVLVFLKLRGQAEIINFAFFGLHCLLVGWLIVRSTFLPRVVGVLMVAAGLGWLTYSFASLLSPPFARHLIPYIMLPGVLGEGSLTFWLLVMGVNVERWKEQARS